MRFVRLARPVEAVACGVVAAPAPSELPLAGSRRMDRYAALGCAAAAAALDAAPGIRPERGDAAWGVIVGSSLGCWASNGEYLFDLEHRRTAALSPALFVRTVASAVTGEICIAHGIGGVNHALVSGWSAGAEALAEAAALLVEGRARFMLAGGVEAPDEALRGRHAERRREAGLAWLPETIEEAAALCLLTVAEPDAAPRGPRILAWGRAHDPAGEWPLAEALQGLDGPPIDRVVVTDPVPPDVLGRWRREAEGRRFVPFPAGSAAIGAAGAPLALARADRWIEESEPGCGALLLSRGIEGGTTALVVSR